MFPDILLITPYTTSQKHKRMAEVFISIFKKIWTGRQHWKPICPGASERIKPTFTWLRQGDIKHDFFSRHSSKEYFSKKEIQQPRQRGIQNLIRSEWEELYQENTPGICQKDRRAQETWAVQGAMQRIRVWTMMITCKYLSGAQRPTPVAKLL